jgi:cytochrome P450
MGDFAYSGAFNTMRAGADTARVRKGVEDFAALSEALGTIPWIRAFTVKFPMRKSGASLKPSLAVAEKRKAQGASVRDLFYYLVSVSLSVARRRLMRLQLDEDGEGGHPPMSTATLAMESQLTIGAGSDTTSTAMSNAIFYLLTVPRVFVKLRAELDAATDNASFEVPIQAALLADLPFLNAIM